MDWDQIENKWAAMTRRVRADWTADRPDRKGALAHRVTRIDVTAVTRAERSVVTDATASFTTSAE